MNARYTRVSPISPRYLIFDLKNLIQHDPDIRSLPLAEIEVLSSGRSRGQSNLWELFRDSSVGNPASTPTWIVGPFELRTQMSLPPLFQSLRLWIDEKKTMI